MRLDYWINLCYKPWKEKEIDNLRLPEVTNDLDCVEITLYNKQLCENINSTLNTNLIPNELNRVNENLYQKINKYIKDNASKFHLIGMRGDNFNDCSNEFWGRKDD